MKKTPPSISTEIISSDAWHKNTLGLSGLMHQQKTSGISSLDAMVFTLEDSDEALKEEMSDSDFSDLIGCELSSSVWACLNQLGRTTKYFNKNTKFQIHHEIGGDIIEVSDWLNVDALDCNGNPLFESFGTEGEGFVHIDDNGDQVATISIAAQLVAHDLCEQRLLFSAEWYLARIVQEYFSNRYSNENKIFLIGILWEQLAQKEKHEEDVFKAKKAAKNSRARGEKSGSNRRREKRLGAFMDEIEKTYHENPAFRQHEEMVLRIAFETVIPKGQYGHQQFEPYATEIRSNEPYKNRFEKLFRQVT